MYNFTSTLIPEERRTWRNAYEIEIAALEHEKRRVLMLYSDDSLALSQPQLVGARKTGLLSFLNLPMQMLAALIG